MSRVSVVGGRPDEARMRAIAWGRSGFEVTDGADVIDLLDPSQATDALGRGGHVLINPTPDLDRLDHVTVALPWPFYPPAARLLDRLEARSIGALSMARARSVIEPDDLARELFEKIALIARLFGPVQEVCTQASGLEPPCTVLVCCKHVGRARYSALEVTLVAGGARDDSLELTGSAGVAWLHGGPGRPRSPAVSIHRGDRLHHEDVEGDWQDAIDGCVADFAHTIRSGRPPDPNPALRAAAVVRAALLSARDGRRHPVPGGAP